jgi:pimeloyl-ACP methyl ester carboxylesterase
LTSSERLFRLRRVFAAGLALLLALSGCAAKPSQTFTPQTDAEIPAELAEFYSQTIDWRSCGEHTFCGTVEVPADYSNVAAGKLKLSLAYHEASVAKPLGSIIFNPGGPGSSGVDWIVDSWNQLGTSKLRNNFNLVGFDPRGVGQSEPRVKCLEPKKMDEFLYGSSGAAVDSEVEKEYSKSKLKNFIAACQKNTGKYLGNVDTVSSARDLDVIRAAFGEKQITYLGFSYGTLLGVTYASLFTNRVGKMVLDGAIDPTLSKETQSLDQLQGFDLAITNYLTECLDSQDCPFTGSLASAKKKLSALLLQTETKPLPTDSGRKLSIWGLITGMIMPLYSSDWWPALTQGLQEALDGDGSTLLTLADNYNDRNDSGGYNSNVTESHIAISCLDARQSSDLQKVTESNNRIIATGSIFARYWLDGYLGCSGWPYPLAERPSDYSAKGSNPILVVGTKGDPATPYDQAVSLAESVLANGHLITYNGEGHTAYGGASQCVNDAVDAYFFENVVPAEDPDC